MSIKTNNKEIKQIKKKKEVIEVKKATKAIFCHAQSEKGADLDYHLCRYKINHEGQHRCVACPTTW